MLIYYNIIKVHLREYHNAMFAMEFIRIKGHCC